MTKVVLKTYKRLLAKDPSGNGWYPAGAEPLFYEAHEALRIPGGLTEAQALYMEGDDEEGFIRVTEWEATSSVEERAEKHPESNFLALRKGLAELFIDLLEEQMTPTLLEREVDGKKQVAARIGSARLTEWAGDAVGAPVAPWLRRMLEAARQEALAETTQPKSLEVADKKDQP
jgi:hypothetical protein